MRVGGGEGGTVFRLIGARHKWVRKKDTNAGELITFSIPILPVFQSPRSNVVLLLFFTQALYKAGEARWGTDESK